MSDTTQLQQKLVEIISQLQSKTPEAAHATLESVKIDAISYLVTGFVAVPVLVGLIWFWRKKYMPWAEKGDFDLPYCLAGAGLGILMIWMIGDIILGPLDVWSWAALIHPDYYLAHVIISHL